MKKKCLLCKSYRFEDFDQKEGYKIVQCSNCSLIFVENIPSENELLSYYRNFTYSTGFTNEKAIRKDSKSTLRNLEKIVANKGSVLDIGCGAGFFLHEARKKGWETYGIDTSKKLVRYANEKLNLSIIHGDFKEAKLPHSYFDVVTMIQTIEHLSNPIVFVKKIYKLLKPKGVCCIATPNIESSLYCGLKRDFPYLIPPEHLVYYSPKTLGLLLEKVGFRISKIITFGYPYDLAGIVKARIKKRNLSGKRSKSLKISRGRKHKTTSLVRKFKHILFDRVFCNIFYKFLNISDRGSIVEIYAEK